jgi:protein TonB
MKKVLLLIITFFSIQFAFCQDNTNVSNNNLSVQEIDKKPEYPGGLYAFYIAIGRDLPVPKIEGPLNRLYVNFVIDIDGNVTDIKILGNVKDGSEKRLIKAIKKCPKWTPAERNGLKVRYELQFPVIAN